MSKYILLPCLLFLVLLAACGTDMTTNAIAVQPTHTKIVKSISTRKTTKNAIIATKGPTLLGSSLSDFVAQYGQPNNHTDISGGMYHFQRWAGSNIDYLIISTDQTDKGYSTVVESIGVQSSDNTATPPITAASCASFMPTDAVYKSKITITTGTGYDKIYGSASLARLFPPDAFDDQNNVQTMAGLFDVQYLLKSDGTIDSCNLQIGTQQAQ